MTFTFLLTLCIIPHCLSESWTVSVYTGKRRFAGTDSNVYIRLTNAQGKDTKEYQLTHYNWIPEKNGFPLRNLFEMGAKDRFRIWTDDLKSISKILIRHDNYLPFQADWLLDQVIIEPDHGGSKYTFKCHCWLRREHPYITLSTLPDENSSDKNKINNSPGNYRRTFVIILLILIGIGIGILCFHNEYRRRQRNSSLSLPNTIEPMQRETTSLDSCHPQTPDIESPSSRSQYWMNTIRHWKTLPSRLSSERRTRAAQSSAATLTPTVQVMSSTDPVDEPPSYNDLYPNQNAPMTNTPNSTS
ncbi:hypothetical protein I4U23_028351 [Adineta vaga]|nr:hypothetical protein I4U23_028351 [Adineta vaga]